MSEAAEDDGAAAVSAQLSFLGPGIELQEPDLFNRGWSRSMMERCSSTG
jgi:hypothetical protein